MARRKQVKAKTLIANPSWGPPLAPSGRATICHECKMEGLYKLLRRSAICAAQEYNDLVPVDADSEAEYPLLLQKVFQVIQDLGGSPPEVEDDTYRFNLDYVGEVVDCIDRTQHEDWAELVSLFKWKPSEDPQWPTLRITPMDRCSYVKIEQHEKMTKHERDAFKPM